MRIAVFIMCCAIWGSTWIAIKLGVETIPPITAAACRFIIAGLVLTGILYAKKLSFPSTWKERFALAYPGLYMYALTYTLVYTAEQFISSALTAVIFGSYPLFIALLSWTQLKNERLSPRGWLGLIAGFVGIVLISYNSMTESNEILLGTIFALIATIASAYGTVLHKRQFSKQHIVVSATSQIILGGIPVIVYALLVDDITAIVWTETAIASVIYLAVFGTVIAFLGYYWLLAQTKAITVSLIAFVTPLVAIWIGVGLFQESMAPIDFVGTGLIFSGIWLVLRK